MVEYGNVAALGVWKHLTIVFKASVFRQCMRNAGAATAAAAARRRECQTGAGCAVRAGRAGGRRAAARG